MTLQIVYFAWIRERIGLPKECYETSVLTVRELIAELCRKDDRYALAFSDPTVVRVALDQTMVDLDASLAGATEVAIFPPMTGG